MSKLLNSSGVAGPVFRAGNYNRSVINQSSWHIAARTPSKAWMCLVSGAGGEPSSAAAQRAAALLPPTVPTLSDDTRADNCRARTRASVNCLLNNCLIMWDPGPEYPVELQTNPREYIAITSPYWGLLLIECCPMVSIHKTGTLTQWALGIGGIVSIDS